MELPLKKFTHKKPGETINCYEECTWLGNAKPIYENKYCAVFQDKYPVTNGHLLFVPKKNDIYHIAEAYKLAYYCGEEWTKEGKMDGFSIGQNHGTPAGQTIMWPHIHLIPRKKGDCENATGGIRSVIPNKSDYTKY